MPHGQNSAENSVERLLADLRPAGGGAAGGIEAASATLAQALETGLASRRTVPLTSGLVAGTVPAWANGLRASGSLGPFNDLAGRDVWIDLFPIVRQVSLVRVAGGVSFLTLPIEIFIHLPGPPSPTVTYDVPAGSVWFASQLLDGSAPAGSWTGIQVAGGTLTFSGPVAGTGTEIVVPSGVTVALQANTATPAAATGTGPGQDARDAVVDVPASFRLSIGTSAELVLDAGDTARLSAFGFGTDLTPDNGPVAYDPELSVLAVPLSAQTSPFTVASVHATAFGVAGTAPITAAAWALPVAVIDPASLGAASGAGSLLLRLGSGLTATWLGQHAPVPLPQAALISSPDSLTVAATGQADLVWQQPTLPGGAQGRLSLRWLTTFPLRLVTEAAGVEGVLTQATLSAVLDRPVDLRGERLSVAAPAIAVLFLATAAGTFLVIDGALQPPSPAPTAFALVNAVLRAEPPTSIVLYGQYDGTVLSAAGVLLSYRLLALIPTLPDPYAASYGSILTAVRQEGSELVSILNLQATASSFDFQLQSAGGATALATQRGNPFLAAQSPTALVERGGTDLWPAAAQATGSGLAVERSTGVILLDVSSNVGQFGVAWDPAKATPAEYAVQDLSLVAPGTDVLLLTLPAVQWEAVETIADPGPDPLPTWVGFSNSGVPAVLSVPTAALVPVEPAAAVARIVGNFARAAPLPGAARFTLPFGIVAFASLHGPATGGGDARSTTVVLNQPVAGSLQGALQLRIDAHDAALPAGESPSFDGYTVQLPVAQPGNRSVLGDDATSIFNSYLGEGGGRPLVPVTRIDLSGYGESLFSDWVNPYTDAVAVSQARFDVLIGRTAFEVVQVRSILFPYAVEVVRTITMERRNNAIVTRTDSGWKALGDGVYSFPGSAIVTHPGVVTRMTGVVNINDTGQVFNVGGIDMAAVYFDGDLVLDGAPANSDGTPRLAPARGQFGFIQITAQSGGGVISPSQYADLLSQAGPLGGPLNTDIRIGSGPQVMHLRQVGVGVTQGLGGPEFVMAASGAPAFPGGGQWSVVEIDGPTIAPTALASGSGVPLIRAGAAGTAPLLSSPYRFADPADLSQPGNPGRDYAVLHAMGTQRALYPRPKIEATDPTRITSTQPGTVADPYSLGTATGPYPAPDTTVPFPTAAWALAVSADGNYTLSLPSPFAAGVGRRTLMQAGSVRGDVDYTAAEVTYAVDTAQAAGWQFRVDNLTKIMNTTALGDVVSLTANIVGSELAGTQFEEPQVLLGGVLSIVQVLLTLLADLGITGVMTTQMTNDWAFKVAVTVPVVDQQGHPLQIPPYPAPEPTFKLDDTDVRVEWDVAPHADGVSFTIEGQPTWDPWQALFKFQVQLSTKDGTDYGLLLGFGYGWDFDEGPFHFEGLVAVTIAGVVGDSVLGFAIGFLAQLKASIKPIISLTVSLEGQLALVWACQGTPSETTYGAAKLTFTVEASVCLLFSITFEASATAHTVLSPPGPGEPACPFPDVLPNAS
jgi:hypothetical protein